MRCIQAQDKGALQMQKPPTDRTGLILAVIAVATLAAAVASSKAQGAKAAPAYTADGSLGRPGDYRTWIYLSTGLDMSYLPAVQSGATSAFDSVFVNPEAYASFLKTGTWPDKTVMVLEARRAQKSGSINQHGRFQAGEPLGMEVHVKDAKRFPGGWAFFGFQAQGPGKLIPQSASCYSCHADHAAVDTTFVQFYPTLLPIAQAKKTLSAKYLAETAGETRTLPPPAAD
jgi:hypothetical protein